VKMFVPGKILNEREKENTVNLTKSLLRDLLCEITFV